MEACVSLAIRDSVCVIALSSFYFLKKQPLAAQPHCWQPWCTLSPLTGKEALNLFQKRRVQEEQQKAGSPCPEPPPSTPSSAPLAPLFTAEELRPLTNVFLPISWGLALTAPVLLSALWKQAGQHHPALRLTCTLSTNTLRSVHSHVPGGMPALSWSPQTPRI